MIYTVDQFVAKSATGRDRNEVAQECAASFQNVKTLVTREEVDAWIAELRLQHQQQTQQ